MPPFNPKSKKARREYYAIRPTPPPAPKPGLSPQAWAQREAERWITAQVQSIQAQQQAYLDELRRQAELRAREGQNLAAFLTSQNFPGRVQGIYNTAASDIAGYAQGFSGDIRDIASQGAAEQANMLAGTGQEGAVRNEGEGMGNVMYGAYGYSPAKSFTESGAAFASDAALQPAFASQQAAVEAARIQQEGMAGLADFAKAIAEAKGQKPSLVMDLLDKRRASVYDAQDRKTAAQDRQREWFLRLAAYYNAIGDDQRAEQYLRLAQQRENRFTNKDKGLDTNGKPLPGYHVDPKTGAVVKNKTASSRSGTDWADIQKDMADEDLTTKGVDPAKPWAGEQDIPMVRKQAYRYLWNKYSGYAKTNEQKARLRRLINRILDMKGIPRPNNRSLDPNGPENPGR